MIAFIADIKSDFRLLAFNLPFRFCGLVPSSSATEARDNPLCFKYVFISSPVIVNYK
nr:MAG TPA: hypothetical protein [Caudoviricetes sp.]